MKVALQTSAPFHSSYIRIPICFAFLVLVLMCRRSDAAARAGRLPGDAHVRVPGQRRFGHEHPQQRRNPSLLEVQTRQQNGTAVDSTLDRLENMGARFNYRELIVLQ